ncbi:MAG: isoprenylcysteine carboxylmethyltransferase family protein [Caldilineaceae bacterium]
MTTPSPKTSPMAFALNVLMSALFFPALTLLLAGNWRWVEGWLFALWFVVMIEFSLIYLYWKDPALLSERTKPPGSDNQKSWDKLLMSAILVVALLWLVVLPLDAGRFHWSPAFPLWLKIVGAIALLPALYLIERTTIDNTFLSAMVRIQSERKQQVITTGVYGFVRHPLYLGVALMLLGAPLLVGSVYGLILSLISLLLLVVRIVGEEQMLVEELDGYTTYQQKVKHRLIPFVW